MIDKTDVNSNITNEFSLIAEPGKEKLFQTHIPNQLFVDGHHELVVIVGKHRYYDLINTQLILCAKSTGGKIKAPFEKVNPMDLVWKETQIAHLKFYLAIIKFQNVYEKSPSDLESLKALVSNPFHYRFYYHDHRISDRISPKSLAPLAIQRGVLAVRIVVQQQTDYYTVKCEFSADDTSYSLKQVTALYDYFISINFRWYLCEDQNTFKVLSYFLDNGEVLTLSYDSFARFRNEAISLFELYVPVEFNSLHADEEIRPKEMVSTEVTKIIYLTDLGNYVGINPVVKYGSTEVPVLSRRQIYLQDTDGRQYKIERDGAMEDHFIALLLKQDNSFEEQLLNPLLYFYLPKSFFLEQHQFLAMFEDWKAHAIAVFGFSEIKGNRFNANKGVFTMRVSSGVNWFNTEVQIQFGSTRASLLQLKHSLRNKSRYIQLDDGTVGIIPQEWIERFKNFFRVADVSDEYSFRVSKINFSFIESAEGILPDAEVKEEVARLERTLKNIREIPPVPIPDTLNAQLRKYQHQGLSWLNLLDDLKFGGCLADDMGLGKSIQTIAFLLHLKQKRARQTHLIVMPTTLLFSWKEEFEKFAPGLLVHTQHGNSRVAPGAFKKYDVVLTSYGTMVQDVQKFAKFNFGYVILDESQNIKNFSSQRYKAACMLKSDHRLILSGTPFENNVFDLYSLLSFVCPGLLGSRTYFRDTYGIPIMKYQIKRAALSLQRKIRPFILRRTKAEVAQELPDKTEVILYCEMDQQQANLYASEEKKFKDYIAAIKQDELLKHSLHVLKGLTRLRQICNSPLLLKDEALHTTNSAKIDLLMEQLDVLCLNHKVLVFSQFVSMLDLVATSLTQKNIPFITLTGKTKNRKQVVDQFNDDKELRVFLISLKTGGTGLNLTAADYVFIVDPWWNPAVENQAIDRAYRIGQGKNVVAVRLICKHSIEEKILVLQQKKADLSRTLIDAPNSLLNLHSKTDLLALVS